MHHCTSILSKGIANQDITTCKAGGLLRSNQPAVAKLERRTDMYVSNLRAYIEAMGGRLNIIAEFPQGNVSITNFADVADKE